MRTQGHRVSGGAVAVLSSAAAVAADGRMPGGIDTGTWVAALAIAALMLVWVSVLRREIKRRRASEACMRCYTRPPKAAWVRERRFDAR